MTKRRAAVLRLSPLLLPREAFAVARQEDCKLRNAAMLHAWLYEPNPDFPGVNIDAIHQI